MIRTGKFFIGPRRLLLGIAGALLVPATANADCDLLQKFSAVQANGFNVVFELNVVDGQANGSAHYLSGPDLGQVNGQADGTFDGLSLTVDVHWQTGAVGHYEGRIDPDTGRLAGATKNLGEDPSGFQAKANWVKWSSKQQFDCVAEPGVSPSAIAAGCSDYATSAVAQNEENIALKCGFTDERWNSNRADHENWCRDVGPDAAAKHTAARKTALEKCRYEIAHPITPMDKLGIEQGSRTGEILKETQPPSQKDMLGIEQGPKIGDFLKGN